MNTPDADDASGNRSLHQVPVPPFPAVARSFYPHRHVKALSMCWLPRKNGSQYVAASAISPRGSLRTCVRVAKRLTRDSRGGGGGRGGGRVSEDTGCTRTFTGNTLIVFPLTLLGKARRRSPFWACHLGRMNPVRSAALLRGTDASPLFLYKCSKRGFVPRHSPAESTSLHPGVPSTVRR